VRRQSPCLIDAREHVAYVTFFRCCPRVPDHVKANAKQIIEGKAAPKVLKKQSGAVVQSPPGVPRRKLASAGMASDVPVPGTGNSNSRPSLRRARPRRSAPPLPHSFIPAIFLRTMRMRAAVFREMAQAIKMAPATYAPPITPRSMANCSVLCSLVSAPSARRRTAWLVTLFRWNDLASEGLG
jgi:hypothetical protein